MEILIQDHEKIELECNQLKIKLQIAISQNLQDEDEQQNLINKLNSLIKIKDQLRLDLLNRCNLIPDNTAGLELQQYQLTCQQVLQYLLSILNFIIKQKNQDRNYSEDQNGNFDHMNRMDQQQNGNQDEMHEIKFYSNPNIKIKCYISKPQFKNSQFHKLDLRKFDSYINQFIHHLFNPIIFNTQAMKIIMELLFFKKCSQSQQQLLKNIRILYGLLLQHIDLEQYLKEELFYEIKDKISPFVYNLQNCNYSICFNDQNIKNPNGPGFLPIFQKIRGYKGYGNLLITNLKVNEWSQAIIYDCSFEILMIYKKLFKASFHLFEQKLQFRYITKFQIIKYYSSYRILYHNIEKSTYKSYLEHYENFIKLFYQFLKDNNIEARLLKQFNHFVYDILIEIRKFFDILLEQVYQNIKQFNPQYNINPQEIYIITNQIVQKVINKEQQEQQLSSQSQLIENLILNPIRQYQKKDIISYDYLEKIIIKIINQLQLEKCVETQQMILNEYFKKNNFKIEKLSDDGSQSMIESCQHLKTNRQFVLASPRNNYDYLELKLNIQKIQNQIQKKQRKGICKVFKFDENEIWMEYAQIGSLQNYLSKNNLIYFEKLLLCQQISSIIRDLHNSNIYHLDIKLENFLVFKKYGLHRVKICDFGSVTNQKEFFFNIDKNRMAYSPPECKRSEKFKSDQFDLWQLGNNVFKIIFQKKEFENLQVFKDLLNINIDLRPDINKVIESINKEISQLTSLNIQYDLTNNKFNTNHHSIINQQDQKNQKSKMIDISQEFYFRIQDKQTFYIELSYLKIDLQKFTNKELIIHDILSSMNYWTQIILIRKETNIQKNLKYEYWSINQKCLFLLQFIRQLFHKNYMNENQKILQDKVFDLAKEYAEQLINQSSQDNYEIEQDFITKIIAFQSLVIDFLEHSYKKNFVLQELQYVVGHILKKKQSVIINKIFYYGNIEYALSKMIDLQFQLKFGISENIIRINGFIYMICQDNQNFYLQLTREAVKQNLDQIQLNLSKIIENKIQNSQINFQIKIKEDYQLFKLVLNNSHIEYIKFILQQVIFQFRENNMLSSPYNYIDGVFISFQNKKLIQNNIYYSNKDLNDQVNLIDYVANILLQQLRVMGSLTQKQKLKDKQQILENKNNIDDVEKVELQLVQLVQIMLRVGKQINIKKQLDIFYYIRDHWNSGLENLILLFKEVEKNNNFIDQILYDTYQYIQLNEKSNFQYIISTQELKNSYKIYRAFINCRILEVIIQETKFFKINQIYDNRILIDQFKCVEFSKKVSYFQNNNKNKIFEILKYNVYLEINQDQLYQIFQHINSYQVFDWINLLQALLSRFDVYTNFQYLKIQFGQNLILRFLVLIKSSSKQIQFYQDDQLSNIIINFKHQDEYKYLNNLLNILKNSYDRVFFQISNNILQLKIQMYDCISNFVFFVSQLYKQQTDKQINQIVYLAQFFLVYDQYCENIYYDLEEEQIYLHNKNKCFILNYSLFFQDGKIDNNLKYGFITSLLKNFQFQINQSIENQLDYIRNLYQIQTIFEKDYEIVSKIDYVFPKRIIVIKERYKEEEKIKWKSITIQEQEKEQQEKNQLFLCCYHLGQEYLNYENFQVIKKKNPLDYHCLTKVKLNGEIIQSKDFKHKNADFNQLIDKITLLAEKLYNQGYEFDIIESNMVIVLNQSHLLVYPVKIKTAQSSMDDIKLKILKFQQKVEQILKNLQENGIVNLK